MAEWFEDDSFWEALYPVTFPPERFPLGEQEVEQVLRLVPLRGGTVLDLCCGPGRHAVPLARRGLEVAGEVAMGRVSAAEVSRRPGAA